MAGCYNIYMCGALVVMTKLFLLTNQIDVKDHD